MRPINIFFQFLRSINILVQFLRSIEVSVLFPQTQNQVSESSGGKPPATKTICFCCENEENVNNRNKRNANPTANPYLNPRSRFETEIQSRTPIPRSGRTIKIENPRQSARVFKHQEFLKRSLSCVDQVNVMNA
jgi:hypothetical protein